MHTENAQTTDVTLTFKCDLKVQLSSRGCWSTWSCIRGQLQYHACKKTRKTHVTLTFDLWPWNSLGFERLLRYTFLQNLIELTAAVHELSWSQRKQDHQALLKAKYCPWVAAAPHTQKTKKTLLNNGVLQFVESHVQCACKISSSYAQRFMSYRVHKLFCWSLIRPILQIKYKNLLVYINV